MWESLNGIEKSLILSGGALFISILLLIASAPVGWYLKGQANAQYIQQTRGIDMEWYHAAAYDIDINSTEADVRLR